MKRISVKLTKKSLFTAFFVLLLVVISWLGARFWSFLNSPLVFKDKSAVVLLHTPGSSARQLAQTLEQQGLLKHPTLFLLFVRLYGSEHNLQAGEYNIDPGTTPYQLVRKMVSGQVIRYKFTIVEGWTFEQVIAALNSHSKITHTIDKMSMEEIMAKIDHPGEFPEGRFAPDTYWFNGYVVDIDLLKSAYQLMAERLQAAWEQRDPKVPYLCPYEALIVASLIEKETALAREKPIIANIILSRLKKRMFLQIDHSVIYGLGNEFSGKLKKADLRKDGIYNTYRRKGLPPSPISMPSLESIEAALHPIFDTNSLYYVTKGDGTHEFSDSLKKQSRAIKKYLLHK